MIAHATPPTDHTPQSALQACAEAGQRAIQENRWADAVKWLDRATELNAGDTALAGSLAFALSRDKQYGRAVQVLHSLHDREPQIAKWPYMVGYQHYMQGEWRSAAEWFDKALAVRPDYPVVLYRKGYALLQLGDMAGGLRELNRCCDVWRQLGPAEQEARQSTYSGACFQIGKAYLNDGYSLKARRPLAEAVRYDSRDGDKRYELGKCLLKNGAAREAVGELQEADRLKPGSDYILDRLARACMSLGDFVQAEAAYARISEHRRRPYVLVNLGDLLVRQSREAEAIGVLRRAVQREPQNFRAHFLLGVCHEALGERGRARREFEEAIRVRQREWNRPYPEAETRLQALGDATIESVPEEVRDSDQSAETGVIEAYVEHRGFGFIRSDVGEKVFFHVSVIPSELLPAVGLRVLFEAGRSEKGPKANWVRASDPAK